MKKMTRSTAVLACIGVLAAGFAYASPAAEGDWSFEITPYFWGSGIDGQVGVGALPPADVSMSFSDLLDSYESGIAVFGVARKGAWFGAVDFSYLDAETTESLPLTQVKLGNESIFGKLVAGYRVTRLDLPVQADLFGGARYYWFKTDLSVSGVGSEAKTEDWVDPLIGMNLVWFFAENWHANLMADIGGFGVGSDLAWEVIPMVQYQMNQTFSAKLGYRWLAFDYETTGYKSDLLIQGWMAGVGISF